MTLLGLEFQLDSPNVLEREDDGEEALDVDGEGEDHGGGPGGVEHAEHRDHQGATEDAVLVPPVDGGQAETEDGRDQEKRVRHRQAGQQGHEGVLWTHG